MAVVVSNIALPFTAPSEEAAVRARKKLGNPPVRSAEIVRRSVDARKRDSISFVYSVRLELEGGEAALVERLGDPQIRLAEEPAYDPPTGQEIMTHRPVIAGFGPAGLFAGLLLARKGYRPLILERGGDMDTRVGKVNRFWQTGQLDCQCNVQFGEGGAGTFSDGKLTTRINDPRCIHILKELAAHGAPREILIDAKPHIGTDLLRRVVKSIREEILRLGGEVRFETQLDDITVKNGSITGILAAGEEIPAEALLLAVGHSARDTFAMLKNRGVPLVSKPFSVGVRIEHLQAEIDRALYGKYAGHPLLPAGEYQLSHREGERAVYTFCMCPGGTVVPAASEEGMVVTNGMSQHARDGKNANSALVVSVDSRDFGDGPLDGLAFQRRLEQAAFQAGGGGYRAPYQTAADFLGNSSDGGPKVEPGYALGVAETDLATLFPERTVEMMRTGLLRFGKRLRRFDAPGAALTGVESRTSSPVRIPRGEDLICTGAAGIYPCGEGAGYAGGIVSAAVDGLRAAEALMAKYRPF